MSRGSSETTNTGPKPGCSHCGGLQYITRSLGELAVASSCLCVQDCEMCVGRGFVFAKNDDGYTIANPCQCSGLDDRVDFYNRAQIPARFHKETLESFEERGGNQRQIKYELLKYRQGFRPGQRGYLLAGAPGTGKTHLVGALLSYFTLEFAIPCRFIDFGYLTTLIKQGYSEGKGENEIIDDLVEAPVLCVDELGKGRGSEWELTVLDALVNRRYNSGLSTFFTSNFALSSDDGLDKPGSDAAETDGRSGAEIDHAVSEIKVRHSFTTSSAERLRYHPAIQTLEDRIGARIYSRLHEMCVMRTVVADDIRKADRSQSTW